LLLHTSGDHGDGDSVAEGSEALAFCIADEKLRRGLIGRTGIDELVARGVEEETRFSTIPTLGALKTIGLRTMGCIENHIWWEV